MKFLAAASALLATTAHAASSAPFSYDPESPVGPQNWHNLPIDGNACGGRSNSPIAIESKTTCDRYEDYEFKNGDCTFAKLQYSLTNTGVKASFPADEDNCNRPQVRIPGVAGLYEALQFHIHTSSEHTIDGKFYGAELHAVHQEITTGERFAVVGMMIQPDGTVGNGFFEELLRGWEHVLEESEALCGMNANTRRRQLAGHDDHGDEPIVFSPYELLERDDVSFYHYDGGLTTPPCSEVVWWNLADEPLSISVDQYMRLVELVIGYIDPNTCKLGTNAGPVGSTSRPVQPTFGRTVERVCPTSMMETSN